MHSAVTAALPIDILMAGHPPKSILERHGDFDSWFTRHMSGQITTRVFDLPAGDPIPDPAQSCGWIITGSPASVYDEIAWLPMGKQVIAGAVAAGHPMLGICFGHQLLAEACGGKVGLNPAGWELGDVKIKLTAAGEADQLFRDLVKDGSAYGTHRDTVLMLPEGADLLAENERGVQAFRIGTQAYGVQFHPEFDQAIAADYVALRQSEAAKPIPSPQKSGEIAATILTRFTDKISMRGKDDNPTI